MIRVALFSALSHTIFVVVGLLVYVLTTRIGHQRRPPSSAIGWVIGIVAFPYIAVPLFLVLGSRKFKRPERHLRSAIEPPPGGGPVWVTQLLASMELPGPAHNEMLVWHDDGPEALQRLLALVDGAQQRLDLSTFIFGNDEVGDAVVEALIRCTQRGVRVRLLIDAIGSVKTRAGTLRRLRAHGVRVRRFMPLLHNPRQGRLNLRNHRKVVVADGWHVWSGGRNLAVEYFCDRPDAPAWLDLTHEARGDLAVEAAAQFDLDWRTASGRRRGVSGPPPYTPVISEGPCAQWVASGPDHADDTVHALLLAAAYHAQQRILAVTPYFVPDDALLYAWCMASRRGVDVNVLVPARSNHLLADWARGRALRELCASGGKVWLLPQMAHAKAVVVDDDLALSGSLNLDGRSLFLNYEVMTAFYSTEQVQWLVGWFERQIATATPFNARQPGLLRDMGEGLVRSVGFQL
ncbi:phospholipase D-like domain-containing protein [Diaphorobacter aerolatus]|uniref:Cardiolipin synthase n=1 Tax=Diaphorobacter aerolatus TaxID=1288495 RepID=A0A7H0GHN8_9BURK|nr:phospholipase D-like domain-containing protein [Diaphorobacter aerolatus]QNP47804.1 cardiolipin synthase [Diaphorobacter aerolatus]